jgi:hypothetical protein
MRFSHTARRCSGVISSFGGFRGGGGRISANDRGGAFTGGALTVPEGFEIEAVSDEAPGGVLREEVVERLAELEGTAFGACSEGLSREPVCCAMGSGWLLETCSCLEEEARSCEDEPRGSGRMSRVVRVGDKR